MNITNNNNLSQLQYLQGIDSIKPFAEIIKETEFYPLKTNRNIKTLQVNVGKVCNLMCKHCHVEAGPHRKESMTRDTMSSCLKVLAENKIPILDITGGSPEMNPNLTWFIAEAEQLGCHVIIRTNLTVLEIDEYIYIPEFYAEHKVEIVSSLPYYSEKDADRQRGEGVFQASIKMLAGLNALGYGQENGALVLNLVYNPGGAFLPPAQDAMEADYRRVLLNQYGIRFNHLFTITNVPVGRFLKFLYTSGNLNRYMERLASCFNPSTVNGLMCRDQVSVGWDGQLYDCDFNQMLELNCSCKHIAEFDLEAFQEREILLCNHCYACTAGSGSSCGGAVA